MSAIIFAYYHRHEVVIIETRNFMLLVSSLLDPLSVLSCQARCAARYLALSNGTLMGRYVQYGWVVSCYVCSRLVVVCRLPDCYFFPNLYYGCTIDTVEWENPTCLTTLDIEWLMRRGPIISLQSNASKSRGLSIPANEMTDSEQPQY